MKLKEGWWLGLKDVECFFVCDLSGVFVGELNGKFICCVIMVKYGDSFVFGGCYIVSNEYRGKGYGRMIYDVGLVSVMFFCCVVIFVLLYLEELYKWKGFWS